MIQVTQSIALTLAVISAIPLIYRILRDDKGSILSSDTLKRFSKSNHHSFGMFIGFSLSLLFSPQNDRIYTFLLLFVAYGLLGSVLKIIWWKRVGYLIDEVKSRLHSTKMFIETHTNFSIVLEGDRTDTKNWKKGFYFSLFSIGLSVATYYVFHPILGFVGLFFSVLSTIIIGISDRSYNTAVENLDISNRFNILMVWFFFKYAIIAIFISFALLMFLFLWIYPLVILVGSEFLISILLLIYFTSYAILSVYFYRKNISTFGIQKISEIYYGIEKDRFIYEHAVLPSRFDVFTTGFAISGICLALMTVFCGESLMIILGSTTGVFYSADFFIFLGLAVCVFIMLKLTNTFLVELSLMSIAKRIEELIPDYYG